MTSKEALEILKHSGLGYTQNQFEVAMTVVEKDLDILDKLKKVLSKVAYTPEFVYGKEDENGFIPVNCAYKVTCGKEFDIILFKKLVDQLGFELVKKETEAK